MSIKLLPHHERNGTHDIHYVAPNFIAKIGVDYHSSQGVAVAVFNSYLGEAGNFATGFAIPKAQNILTANMRFNINQLLNNDRIPSTEFSLYGNNLFDSDITTTPGIVSATPSVAVPVGAGRAVYGKLSVKF